MPGALFLTRPAPSPVESKFFSQNCPRWQVAAAIAERVGVGAWGRRTLAASRAQSRTRSIERLEDRQVMSADPVGGLLGGSIQQHELEDAPSLVHHASPDADFWIDSWSERDVETLVGDIEQTLASAHDSTGLTGVRNDYGFTGAGQTVAVIDSGIAWDHSALGGGLGANYRVVGGWDFTENDANPYDDGPWGSHGTHVAGIVGADAAGTNYDGVAPGVDLVGLRVFDDAGAGLLQLGRERAAVGPSESQRVRESDHGGEPVAGHVVELEHDSVVDDARRRVRPAEGGRHLHRRFGRQFVLQRTTRRA